MTIRRNTFDQRSYDLAEVFLEDEPVFQNLVPKYQLIVLSALAGDIQGAIEDFDLASEAKEALKIDE